MKRQQCSVTQTASTQPPALQLPLDFSAPLPTAPCGSASACYRSRKQTSADVRRRLCVNDSERIEVGSCASVTAKPAPLSSTHLLPRFVRFRDAPRFFGMDKNRFNREIRPHLTEILSGRQGMAFDRLEMEASAEEYRSRNGRPAAAKSKPWDKSEGECQDSSDAVECGTSTSLSTEHAFAKALAHATARKPNHC